MRIKGDVGSTELRDQTMRISTKARGQPEALPSPEAIDIKRTALLLDVDGTLLDIAATPYSVVVPPSLRTILSDLLEQSGAAVALVSGRTIETLDGLFAPLKTPAIGGHGAEIRVSPHGPRLQWLPAMITEPLRRQIHLLARVDPHVLVEDKPHSIAVHYRLALQQETFLMKEVATIVSREPPGDFEILFGKAVMEIKPTLFSKGSAVSELMRYPAFAGRVPLFIGDDITDESVFGILPELAGFGYSVGRAVAGVQGTFQSPEDVRAWLTQVWSHCRRAA